MAHFAELDNDNTVIRIIVADTKEWCETNLGGTWIQTSYNTFAGEHKLGGTPLHKNYAGIGFKWDGTGFYSPQPFPSWTLDKDTYIWEAPTPRPSDDGVYVWNESKKKWEDIS